MDTAFIKSASITSAQIGSVNADTISTGTLNANRIAANSVDASKIKIDNATITSNASGQIVIGSIAANSITTGTLDASLVTIDNLYANNITGDINTLTQFTLASSVQVGAGDTQVWSGQFEAMETGGKPKKPFIAAGGFGIWENDVVYKIKLEMRPNVPATTVTVGDITDVTAAQSLGSFGYIPASVSFSGDVQNKVQNGGTLKIGSTERGTVISSSYSPNNNKTEVYHIPVNGGFSSSHIGSTVTQTNAASFITVATSMFRADYDGHPEPFYISGGLPTAYSVTVDARIMFDTLYVNGGGVPSTPHNTNWNDDEIFSLDGLMMSLR